MPSKDLDDLLSNLDADAGTSDYSEDESEGSEAGAEASGFFSAESGDDSDSEQSQETGDSDSEQSQEAGDSDSEQSQETGDSDSERGEPVEESDSSEDEVPPRNTIGDVPLEWYKEEEHVGYDIKGKKITKRERQDKLDSFLASVDDSKNWRKIHDEYNDEVVEVTKEETRMIRRLLSGQTPHPDADPYPSYVDWFKWKDSGHPLSNAPEPKRRFIPSKWEAKKVVEYVRAIRKGLIKFDKPKEEPRLYMLWADDSGAEKKAGHLSYVPPPKADLPGHEESYNPSLEYIPMQEELDSYQLMDEEDRPEFIPKRFTSMRSIPAYEDAVKDSFERCLDLYLCPRVRRNRVIVKPEDLKPKGPNKKDLKPYPVTCYIEYRGHKGPVLSISTEASGEWLASGSADGTVRMWDVDSGRCHKVWEFDESVHCVAWNPMHELPILAVSTGQDAYLLNTGLGNEETQRKVRELLQVDTAKVSDDTNNTKFSWIQDDEHGGIRLRHPKMVSSVEWHRRGDFFSTVMPAGDSKSVALHRLSSKETRGLPCKLKGLAVSSAFHPTKNLFFAVTKKKVVVYDLKAQKTVKKLEPGLRELSSIAVHPSGEHVIVGSREGKLCWFDLELSSPYDTLKPDKKDVNSVAFHHSYPLFASAMDNGTACVYHGMVYSNYLHDPKITTLEVLGGHTTTNGRGVMDCKFHPGQPWLFTAGADSLIKLYCHY